MKSIVFLITLFLLAHPIFSQTDTEEKKCPETIPEAETGSVATMSDYINKNFKTKQEKIMAIYCWLGNHIAYDVPKAAALNQSTSEEHDKEKNIRNTLSSRKGVCQDYAELMEALCKNCGIDAYSIYGIVRKSDKIGEAHAWISAFIDGQWRIYDPTWGAGYVNNDLFTQRFTFDQYDIPPTTAITSHLPYDPMWQLLRHPISVEAFYNAEFQENKSTPLFNFSDTIALFKQKDTIQQCYEMIRRIEADEIYNQATADYLFYLKNIIENDKVQSFNLGVAAFNNAVNVLNQYSNYYNRQFTPEKSREEVENMLLMPESDIKTAMHQFQSIKAPSADMAKNINNLNANMKTMLKKIDDNKSFVQKYFETDMAQRKMLFYKPTGK